MESAGLAGRARGRKRSRNDTQNSSVVDRKLKKRPVETRSKASKAFIGRYVKKEFEGSGTFLGKIVHYDTGLYRVSYEDGDCEDLESGEVKEFLVADEDFDDKLIVRKKKLDELVSKKDVDTKEVLDGNVVDSVISMERVEASSVSEPSNAGANEVDGVQVDGDADSSTDSCECGRDRDSNMEVEPPLPPPPQLPPSSGSIGVPDEYISHLFSVYNFLRSFSIQLFLSPFTLDDFVGSLNSCVPNTLVDAIHLVLMRALRRHLETLSSDGSDLASKCTRCIDWSLLDTLTWPVYLVQYLMVMGYTKGIEWKGFYLDVLERGYYSLSAGQKLLVLQILCDDILDSAEIRAEIDMREEAEGGLDSDAVTSIAPQSGPRRVHPRYSKTSACKDREAMEIISESHEVKSTCESSSLGFKGSETGTIEDDDLDGNGDECRLCGMDGTLLCCDGCPSAYHSRCIGVSKMGIPEGAWYCPECAINKIGPRITRGTFLKGAEILGIDIYEQVFIGTCNHLLVLKISINSEPCLRYYNQNDIPDVLRALHSSLEHMTSYSEICRGILEYWDVPEDVLSLPLSVQMDPTLVQKKENGECFTPSLTLPSKEGQQFSDMAEGVNFASSAIKDSEESMAVSDKSSAIRFAPCASGNSNTSYRGNANGMCITPNAPLQIEEGKDRVTRRGSVNVANDLSYMGSSFRPQSYINHYVHGDFAASAAANLAVYSSEENRVSESHALHNQRKVVSANTLLQAKAFSSAAMRFFWPNVEKKLVEVPRERCGWCLSCKAPPTSKKACLLNAAASNAIKGATKILAGLRFVKNREGSLSGIAAYVILLEESLCGLTVGPFLNATYRREWRKQVERATTCSALKTLLLELEENIRIVALFVDWVKLVDYWAMETSMNGPPSTGSVQKRGASGRRGRKHFSLTEIMADDNHENLSDFTWWQGGTLSKLIFQKAILPRSLVMKAACQGGSRKIPGISYDEKFEVPRRSRQFVWRAAVEMSRTPSQLALQVRYLDIHVRWNDLVRPEQTSMEVKGPETEASVFRNAFICDKKIVESAVRYGVAFGSQKHLPSRVMKNIIEVEQSQDGKEKCWFSETRIPLYLIKEYEEKVDQIFLPSADKPTNKLSKLQKRQLKASRKDIFSYLRLKRDNLETCGCASCELGVLMRNAVKCSACQGFCHEQCTISLTVHVNEEVEFLITCKKCYHKGLTENENSNESLNASERGQESQSAKTATRVAKRQKPLIPVAILETSSEKQPASNGSSLTMSSRPKICSWGLIWRKKIDEETGTDFRIQNILLKGNTDMSCTGPVCHLCQEAYNPDLMYIRCPTCNNWFHAEALELEESKIFDLVGFKCCRCRRIRSPVCPYLSPEKKQQLEGRKHRSRTQKTRNSGIDPDLGLTSEHSHEVGPAAPMLPMKEEDDPLFFSLSPVEQVTESNSDAEFEKWLSSTASVPGPQKLPVRRHTKHENEVNDFSEFSTGLEVNDVILNPKEEPLTPRVEWDVSTDGFDDNLMFDYGSLENEMEFEPQTYFSFTELLDGDDDTSRDEMANWENISAVSGGDGYTEQYGAGISGIKQEPTVFVGAAGEMVPCLKCSQTEPCPELCCHNCGLCIHIHCSPWNEQSSLGDSWRCGNCREWR